MEMEIGLDEESRSKIRVERRRSLNQSAAERRRRIVERGSDRLDLITGKIRSLSASSSSHLHPDSSSLQLSPHHSGEAAGPSNDEIPPSTLPKLDTNSTDYSTGGDAVEKDRATFPKLDTNSQDYSTRRDAVEMDGATLPKLDTNSPDYSSRGDADEMDRATLQNPTVEDRSSTQPLLIMPMIQEATTDAKPLGGSHRSWWPKLCTHKKINHCILASEKTRACCALIIALLVVLSYIDDPLFGVDIVSSDNVIASRPLYIVLLTDVTIVLAWLLLMKERNLKQPPEQERDEGQESGDLWTDAVRLLESGLVIYRIMRALFLDCSIYLVVVVGGVSLV